MTKLKPCPFCGGEARFIVSKDGLEIFCKECKCGTNRYFSGHYDFSNPVDEAIEAWNRRADNEHTD